MSNLIEERNEFESLGKMYTADKGVSVEPATIAGVQTYWFTPPKIETHVVVVYLHGGGFIYGSIQSHHAMVSHFAKAMGHRILFIDYSLAPEHPFPAALNETVSVILELIQSHPDFKFILMGDSAGGNLVMSAALNLKHLSLTSALGQIVLSPWINLEPEYPSYIENEKRDPILSKEFIQYAAALYVMGDNGDSFASPIAGDFKGLGSTLILVGEKEILRDDATYLHAALEKAECHSELHVFENANHVWMLTDIVSDDARKALSTITSFLQSIDRSKRNHLLLPQT